MLAVGSLSPLQIMLSVILACMIVGPEALVVLVWIAVLCVVVFLLGKWQMG